MNRHRQIITLQIDFDHSQSGPPSEWAWDEVGTNLQGAADLKVLASSPISRTDVAPFRWYDKYNDVFYKDADDALRAAQGGNEVVALYTLL